MRLGIRMASMRGNNWRAQGSYDGRKFDCILEKADGGGTGGSRSVAGSDVFQRNAADGDDGNLNGLAYLAQALNALRRAVKGLRRRMEDGAEINVVRTIPGGANSRAERMARNTNHKIERLARIFFETLAQPARIGNGKAIFADVNAAGSGGEGNVYTIVDEDSRTRSFLPNGV